MSIASELQRIQTAKAGIKSALNSHLSNPGDVTIEQYPQIVRNLNVTPTTSQVMNSGSGLVIVMSCNSTAAYQDESFYFMADDIQGFAIYTSTVDADYGNSEILKNTYGSVNCPNWDSFWDRLGNIYVGDWLIFSANDAGEYRGLGYIPVQVSHISSDYGTYFVLDIYGDGISAELELHDDGSASQSFGFGVDFY